MTQNTEVAEEVTQEQSVEVVAEEVTQEQSVEVVAEEVETAEEAEAETTGNEIFAGEMAETGPVQEPDLTGPDLTGPDLTGPDLTPERLTPERLRPALEAILLVVDNPVADVTLAQVLECPTEEVRTALDELAAEYTVQDRGMDLRQAAGGWRLYTREEFSPYVEKFVLDGQSAKLTQAALETLSVVAYRQPVSRARISAIRGVGVDGVMRTLLTRGLIEECGAEDSGAHLYRTTTLFLEKLGLDHLEQLPSLAPLLPEIEALDDVIAST
jgi:segregation and condensation protein B